MSQYCDNNNNNNYNYTLNCMQPQFISLLYMQRQSCWSNCKESMHHAAYISRMIVQAVECGKGGWVKNIARCTDDFGWSGVGADAVSSLSDSEIQEMLSSAWRNVM